MTIKNEEILNAVLAEIKNENDARDDGTTLSNDSDNEVMLNILLDHADDNCADNEDDLTEKFGYDGYCLIREAEGGNY